MKRYAEWSPTQHDSKGLNLPEQQDWLVLCVGRNRDSDVTEESNWHSALKELGGESESVQVHRFGHWACGWFEIILLQPGTEAERVGAKIEAALEHYSILNDTDHSEREYDAAAELWKDANVSERLRYIDRCGADPKVSPFAARREELPEGIYYNEMLYD